MKNTLQQFIIAVALMSLFGLQPSVVIAQVTLDGSMGTSGQITGPDYDIGSEYGRQAGANLFHSFGQFDINAGETANFGVSPAIQNIISRVTGGQSWIDGTLRSTLSGTSDISGANLYLLNPAGVVFGPQAALDIGGSFHVSTADYLRMGEDERFYAIQYNDVLSSAPPSAFGFLDNDIGDISVEGRGEITEQEWQAHPSGLQVKEGRTVSLVGGNIEIRNGTVYQGVQTDAEGNPIYVQDTDDDGNLVYDEAGNPVFKQAYDEAGDLLYDEYGNPVFEKKMIRKTSGEISAPEGQINLASVASPGEAVLTESAPDVSSFETLGKITLSDNAVIKTSGEKSGDIFIRSGQFFADSFAVVEADTLGDENGGVTNIQADTVSLSNGGNIFSDSQGKGGGGSIVISGRDGVFAESVSVSDNSRIFADTTGEEPGSGDAGAVSIRATNLSLSEGGKISSETEGTGAGGDVTLQVGESLSVSGDSSRIYGGTKMDASDAGDGGNVLIEARDISFTDGGNILSESLGGGRGGNVTILAESVRFSSETEFSSKVHASTTSTEAYAGDAGNIFIKADDISFSDTGGITVSTHGPGNAGTIMLEAGRLDLDTGAEISSASNSEGQGGNAGEIGIRAEDSISLMNDSSVTTATSGGGHAGDIVLDTGRLDISSGAQISSASTSKHNGGDAGTVFIRASNIVRLSDNSEITTLAEDAGKGKITVVAGDRVYVWDSKITTSIKKGGNDAGDVNMNQEILVLNRSKVVANAWEGDGGNIRLIAEPFVQSWDSLVDASSEFGMDGTVYIESPEGDFASMVLMPANLLDATKWMKTPCASRSAEKTSRFVIKGRDAVPTAFDDWQPSPLTWFEDLDLDTEESPSK
ncbi:filamentous hemagglutinin N-terminal domain-containing protein [Desulfobacterales bacterium HSG2]|nr:filamentous hemagglutinin N-terminal domain-containing protein [Desulfobacterales bacterium HSG2]